MQLRLAKCTSISFTSGVIWVQAKVFRGDSRMQNECFGRHGCLPLRVLLSTPECSHDLHGGASRMDKLETLPFREWFSPLAHLPAAILARVGPKRGSAWGQGISTPSILYCWIWDVGLIL